MTGLLFGPEWRGHKITASIILSTLVLVLGALSVALWPKPHFPSDASDICVRNDTGLPLYSVRINGVNYGDIGVGETTPYFKHKHADQYGQYKLLIDGSWVESSPVLVVKPLGPGKFTYVVTASAPFDSHGRHSRVVWVRLEHPPHEVLDPAA